MLRLADFVLILTCISSSSPTIYKYSAASPAQIKFAEENKYDQTGPGAEEPVAAYNTFSKLEDALLSFIDDQDTKLPDREVIKALTALYKKGYTIINRNKVPIVNEYTKAELANEIFGDKNMVFDEYPDRASIVIPKMAVPYVIDIDDTPKPAQPSEKPYENEYAAKSKVSISYNDAFDPKSRYTVYHSRHPARMDNTKHKLNKIHVIKSNPINLAHYSRDTFEPASQYSYSYSVQGRDPTEYRSSSLQDQVLESSRVQETRPKALGSSIVSRPVLGYFTYVDAQGNRKTVQYRASNKDGFRTNIVRYFDLNNN